MGDDQDGQVNILKFSVSDINRHLLDSEIFLPHSIQKTCVVFPSNQEFQLQCLTSISKKLEHPYKSFQHIPNKSTFVKQMEGTKHKSKMSQSLTTRFPPSWAVGQSEPGPSTRHARCFYGLGRLSASTLTLGGCTVAQ